MTNAFEATDHYGTSWPPGPIKCLKHLVAKKQYETYNGTGVLRPNKCRKYLDGRLFGTVRNYWPFFRGQRWNGQPASPRQCRVLSASKLFINNEKVNNLSIFTFLLKSMKSFNISTHVNQLMRFPMSLSKVYLKIAKRNYLKKSPGNEDPLKWEASPDDVRLPLPTLCLYSTGGMGVSLLEREQMCQLHTVLKIFYWFNRC